MKELKLKLICEGEKSDYTSIFKNINLSVFNNKIIINTSCNQLEEDSLEILKYLKSNKFDLDKIEINLEFDGISFQGIDKENSLIFIRLMQLNDNLNLNEKQKLISIQNLTDDLEVDYVNILGNINDLQKIYLQTTKKLSEIIEIYQISDIVNDENLFEEELNDIRIRDIESRSTRKFINEYYFKNTCEEDTKLFKVHKINN